MALKNKSKILVIITVSIMLAACSWSDLNSEIQGKWDIVNASRNGRPTSTFEDGFIRIWNNDTIETNITGDLIKTKFKLQKKMILTDDKLPVFTVVNIEKDTMTFQFKINETHFHLVLSKSGS
jgi:hypothetical protein